MKIRLLHLYDDLLNLYGEYANLSAMERALSEQGLEVETDRKSLGDEMNFSEYDWITLGAGTEKALKRALADLLPRKEGLSTALAEGRFFLATGNSLSLFGEKITDGEGRVEPALGLFSYETKVSGSERRLSDEVCQSDLLEEPCVGFMNTAQSLYGAKTPLFRVRHGLGNSTDDGGEGFFEGSFFGTQLTGPVLIKNPHFASFFVKKLTEKAGIPYREPAPGYERAAYEATLKALCERFEK